MQVVDNCLFEFVWRRNNAGNLWAALLVGLSTVRCAVPELRRVNEVDETWEPTDLLIRKRDMVDYDSNDTEETLSDDDMPNSGEGGGGGAASGACRGAARTQQRWRGQPMVEAVPSALFRQRETMAADSALALELQLGPDPELEATVDGEAGII